MTLHQLAIGSKAIVQAIDVQGLARRRLLDLGLVPGTIVESLRTSPAGNPVAYRIRGTVIALRSSEGNQVRVRPVVGG